MTDSSSPLSAKEQVIAWVRSKNQQTMELKFGCRIAGFDKEPNTFITKNPVDYSGNMDIGGKVLASQLDGTTKHYGAVVKHDGTIVNYGFGDDRILGSDMGLQELLGAMIEESDYDLSDYKLASLVKRYDLQKNLHSQKQSFYEALLPLLPQ